MRHIEDNKRVYLQFTLRFWGVSIFTFFFFWHYDLSLIWQPDGYKQHFPFLVSLRHACKELIVNHRFSLWNWSIGMGDDTLSSLYTTYLDPFSYIDALFPPAHMDLGYGISIVLRL